MKVYIIRQSAVYWHNIMGVFSNLEDAKAHASHLASNDCDSHHSFVVTEHVIGDCFHCVDFDWPSEMPECENEAVVFEIDKDSAIGVANE